LLKFCELPNLKSKKENQNHGEENSEAGSKGQQEDFEGQQQTGKNQTDARGGSVMHAMA
jgi:hypothetical protein